MGDTVEQCAGEALAGEHRGPFLEGQVRCHDCGAVLVASAEDVEQEFASGLRQGHVAELIEDDEVAADELLCGAAVRPWRPERSASTALRFDSA